MSRESASAAVRHGSADRGGDALMRRLRSFSSPLRDLRASVVVPPLPPALAPLQPRHKRERRAGVTTLDYVLILGVILPMVAFMMTHGRAVIGVVYQILCVLISWPFL